FMIDGTRTAAIDSLQSFPDKALDGVCAPRDWRAERAQHHPPAAAANYISDEQSVIRDVCLQSAPCHRQEGIAGCVRAVSVAIQAMHFDDPCA
ncbi:MAG: hypothetical protein ABWY18_10135, partial [Tardiphaga sp.]